MNAILNKKARYNYTIIDEYNAGIVLSGNEVKSIREGKCNISDAYCVFADGELFIRNSHVAEYSRDFRRPDENRDRKLLLNRQELNKLNKAVQQKGNTIVPLKMYFNDRGMLKVLIGLCSGKHTYDKRQAIKERDIDRQSHREM